MNILFILCWIVACTIKDVLGDIDESKLKDYFSTDIFDCFQKQWQTERKSFENALILILEQNYGVRGMNVYVKKMADSYKLSDGFYFSDNIVDGVLLEMHLVELPSLIAPDVTFALTSNFLGIEAGISKMIINTKYLLIRNQSEVTFKAPEEELKKTSPFTFQQVQDSGDLTIIADDCTLNGYTITSLSGNTVNLGHDTFKITNCKFSIEIYSPGLGSPPVIAPYFSKSQSVALEKLLRNPIQVELMPKLQGAVFTYINTSAIFGSKLPEIRLQQNKMFKETSNYVTKIVKNFVKNTIKDNQGILKLKPFQVSWNKTCMDGTCRTTIKLKDMILYGLDTAYSAHAGGPYKVQSAKIVEAIRFSTMQVRGKLYFENATVQGEYDFVAELQDVAVNVEMEATTRSVTIAPTTLDVVGWRSIEFSILDLDIFAYERKASQSLITGYLLNEIPKCLLDYLSQTFLIDMDKKLKPQNSDKSNDDQSSEDSEQKNEDNVTKSNDATMESNKNLTVHEHSDKSDHVKSSKEEETIKEDINKKQTDLNDSFDNGNEAVIKLPENPDEISANNVKQIYKQKLLHLLDNEVK